MIKTNLISMTALMSIHIGITMVLTRYVNKIFWDIFCVFPLPLFPYLRDIKTKHNNYSAKFHNLKTKHIAEWNNHKLPYFMRLDCLFVILSNSINLLPYQKSPQSEKKITINCLGEIITLVRSHKNRSLLRIRTK